MAMKISKNHGKINININGVFLIKEAFGKWQDQMKWGFNGDV